MATVTKKPAAKKAPAKASSQQAPAKGKTDMVDRDKVLAARAEAARAMAQSTAGTSKSIKTAGGVFTIDGQDAGDTLNVIMLDSILEHAWYGVDGQYDPDNPKTPECFALGRIEKQLVPHEDSPDPQSDECKTCHWNKFGTADRGRGKANKNIVRMMVISEDDLDDIEGADARILKVPVTSVKYWSSYVKGITDVKKSDPIKVLTEVKLVKHPKFQFEMKFRQIGDVDEDLVGELIDKSDSIQSELFQPYRPFEESEEEADNGKGADKALAKGNRAKPPARQAPAKAAKAGRGRGR